MARKNTAVVIHPDALALIKRPFARYLRELDGTWYFNCEAVDASGPLLEMTIADPLPHLDGMKPLDAVIRVPYAYVVGTMQYPGSDFVGFIGPAPAEKKK